MIVLFNIKTAFSNSKYSYLKHLNKSNTLHFYHHRAEIKLINNVTSIIRFFQESIHKQKDFASKFCIHIILEPRPFKYYTYFDFFGFFEFYQIHKISYSLYVGRVFHTYLSAADTEIFTTFSKFTDPSRKYKRVFDHRVYFLVHDELGQITTIHSDKAPNIYLCKTFGEVL